MNWLRRQWRRLLRIEGTPTCTDHLWAYVGQYFSEVPSSIGTRVVGEAYYKCMRCQHVRLGEQP